VRATGSADAWRVPPKWDKYGLKGEGCYVMTSSTVMLTQRSLEAGIGVGAQGGDGPFLDSARCVQAVVCYPGISSVHLRALRSR
jgi:hypothetical protein